MHRTRALLPHPVQLLSSTRGLSAFAMVRCSCFAWRFDGKDQRAQQRRVRGPEQQQPAPQQQQEPGPLPLPGPAPLQQPAGAAPAKLLRTELPLQRPVGTGGAIPGARPAPLRVMTFNILADGLAQHGDFVNVSTAVAGCSARCTAPEIDPT